ncbi:hypothetical protein MRB53_030349 [Persea americana]|uniref:Uncharacterized protein n=1 Tax=Persea americana TaxID=3435 RepID=A0ACC2KLF0_PERAE|nr:hypothetical protein MRB53_030349 [Persea americana]
MEQLLNMGFPQELANQALAATGGKSTLKATEWILNQKSTSSSLPPPPPSPCPSQPRKTSIARAISNSNSSPDSSSYRFVPLSAVTAGVKDVRDAVEEARRWKRSGKRTLLFLDEVHRFNKSQQDSFLPVIEDGSIIFIGATTENPSFHLVTPLLSRCQVLRLNPLQPCHVAALLHRAAGDHENGLPCSAGLPVRVEEEAIDFLSHHCDGDARVALNALEVAATSAAARITGGNSGDKEIAASVTLDDAKEAL